MPWAETPFSLEKHGSREVVRIAVACAAAEDLNVGAQGAHLVAELPHRHARHDGVHLHGADPRMGVAVCSRLADVFAPRH